MLIINAIYIIIVDNTPIIFLGRKSAKKPLDIPPMNSATPNAINTDDTLLSISD